jgi:hypothetical protein
VNKSFIFWDATQRIPAEDHRLFGGTYCIHTQGPMVNQSSKQQETIITLLVSCFLPAAKLRWTSARIYGTISQMTQLFIHTFFQNVSLKQNIAYSTIFLSVPLSTRMPMFD